jgi:hypothetical protein
MISDFEAKPCVTYAGCANLRRDLREFPGEVRGREFNPPT